MNTLTHLKEGARIISRRLKGTEFRRYPGDATHICRAIIEDCWNGAYFQTSNGHFNQFYTRDFAFCAEPLIRLGYKAEVLKTLEYALTKFSKANRISTAITPGGVPFDFPSYSTDAVPLLTMTLIKAGAKSLSDSYKAFLEKEISRYCGKVLDPEIGLVRMNNFSTIKDHSKRKSSCYSNSMLVMLNEVLPRGMGNPLKGLDLKQKMKEAFWSGSYFYDDIDRNSEVSGDANIFPFWCRLFGKDMLRSSIEAIEDAGLADPLPLKYTTKNPRHGMIAAEIFARGYQRNTIWLHLGSIYNQIVARADKQKAKELVERYDQMIEREGTFPEVLTPELEPFKASFYFCDEGMLWAAIHLDLKKRLNV